MITTPSMRRIVPSPHAATILLSLQILLLSYPYLAAAEPAATGAWPQFRGPTGNGIAPAQQLPLHWGPDHNIAWKVEMPGPGASSPVLFGRRLFITCHTGYVGSGRDDDGDIEDLQRHLIAFDRETGRELWNQAIPARLPEERRIRDHGYAANTPAIDQERVYVFFGKSGVFAFDHQGRLEWTTLVGDDTSGWGTSASPVIEGDLIIINASIESESLVALNRHTGRKVWSQGGIREAWNSPLVIESPAGRRELLIAAKDAIKAFDPATGNPLWSCDTDITWYMVPTLIEHEGIVYCLGGRSGIAALAVRTGGSGDVTNTHRLWTSENGSNVSSPVYLDGHLYWVHEQRGVAHCAEAATGKLIYEERLGRGGQFYSSPVLADGRLYYLSRRGQTHVVSAEPSFGLLASNDLADGSLFNGSPAVVGGRLFIRSDKFLYCIGVD